jgi:hypothetical protein
VTIDEIENAHRRQHYADVAQQAWTERRKSDRRCPSSGLTLHGELCEDRREYPADLDSLVDSAMETHTLRAGVTNGELRREVRRIVRCALEDAYTLGQTR